jgi:hypothetical protein
LPGIALPEYKIILKALVGRLASDWRYKQIVDAIQRLPIVAGVLCVEKVDWNFYRAGAQGLVGTHPW